MAATDWTKIHLLQGRRRRWQGKVNYARQKYREHKEEGDRSHWWHDHHLHERPPRPDLAKKNEEQWPAIRVLIGKWAQILHEAEHEVHRYDVAIAALMPKGAWWPMGGLVRPGMAYRWQRSDQGQDFEVPIYASVAAPGHGRCLEYAADRAFPNGFGDPYAICEFHDGPFRVWPAAYLGHANEPIIRPGQSFVPGQPLARLNHFLNPGWGWIEFGRWNGGPGGMGEGFKWIHLFKAVYRA